MGGCLPPGDNAGLVTLAAGGRLSEPVGGWRTVRVLLLAGTREARALAGLLADEAGVEMEASLAGHTSAPATFPCPVRTGGFGGVDGLVDHLVASDVDVLADATHPFAATMPWHAAEAADRLGLPRLRLLRPAWEPGPGDRWLDAEDLVHATRRLRELGARCALVTTGRLELAPLLGLTGVHLIVRTIEAPGRSDLSPTVGHTEPDSRHAGAHTPSPASGEPSPRSDGTAPPAKTPALPAKTPAPPAKTPAPTADETSSPTPRPAPLPGTSAPPEPAELTVIRARGPFRLDAERVLLRDQAVDVLVTKNAGGDDAKLIAAREAGIPVVMVRRPPPVPGPTVATPDAALAWLRAVNAPPGGAAP